MVSLGQKFKWPKTCEKRSTSTLELFCGKNRCKKKNQILAKWDNFENRPSCKGYRLCKMVSLGQNFKWPKKFEKRFYKHVRVLLCKKHQILEKWDHFENPPSCKGYTLCKMVSLGQNFKSPKMCEKRFYKHVRVVLCKKPLEKHQIFEKWDQFQNRPPCKGYRLSKMVSLGEKLKWLKTCQKRFYKHVRVVLCKKTAAKNTKYSRNETILKIGHLAKAIDLPKWSVWVKTSNGKKRAKNDSTSTLELFCAKNRCKKHQILEK